MQRRRPLVAGVSGACAALVLSASTALVIHANAALAPAGPTTSPDGGIVRGATDVPRIALLFTGHEFAEGADTILAALRVHRARASFFLTGDFLRRPEFRAIIGRMVADGHYVGPHSDKHLLYCSWEDKRTLVTRDALRRDLEGNLQALAVHGVPRAAVHHWVPAYEWYNREIVEWSAELGLRLVNFTPGTRSTADYTGETDRNFVSSRAILDSIRQKERTDPDRLNGFLLLMHVGAGPGRTDKLHDRLGELLRELSRDGYAFVRVDELLGE